MCGIVGYIGDDQAAPILLQGLEKLEYRGYDSAGVAVYDGTSLRVVKAKGRLQVLKDLIHGGKDVPGTGGHRPHSLGDARRSFGHQFTSPGERFREIRGGTQRHH